MLIGAAVLLAADANHASPASGEVAYIADSQLDIVSVVDTATKTIADTIPVGAGLRPCGIALSPDGRTAYVANPSSETLSVVDLASLTTSSISLSCPRDGCAPKGVVASPDGQSLYVISEDWNQLAVAVIDVATRTVSRTIGVATEGVSGGCGSATITPDGRLLYVRVPGLNFPLSVIDTTAGGEIARIRDGPFYDVIALPNEAAVLAPGDGRIAIIDTATQQVERTIPIDGAVYSVALSSDAATAYVRSSLGVLVVDVVGGSVTATIPQTPPFRGSGLAVTPDGLVLVPEFSTQSIVEIDTATNAVSGRIPLGHKPGSIALTPDGRTLYVTNGDEYDRGGTLSRVDIRNQAVTRLFPPVGPSALAVTPDGARLFVASPRSDELVAVDTRTHAAVAMTRIVSPVDVVVDPVGEVVFVSSVGDHTGSIAVVDRRTMAVIASIALDRQPGPLAIDPQGARLYAGGWSGEGAPNMSVIDTRTLTPIATIPFERSLAALSLALNGGALYAAEYQYGPNEILGGVAFVDPAEERIVGSVDMGGGVFGLAVSPDGRTVYAPTFLYNLFLGSSSQLSVIDTATRSIRAAVPVDTDGPVALNLAGDALYLASRGNPGHLSVIDTATLETLAKIELGTVPTDIVVAAEPGDRPCAGDCDTDGRVTAAELIRGVTVLLGRASVDACAAADTDLDGQVTVADLMRAVNAALNGC